ncbi:MAG: bifunctional UDP-N-acetylglucosamine diphosphorylase/glucosamine-1-phosphate N-acetyltransferase GlmU [Chloroflexi bacterium]|nr:bifunctional UDP-N-acetylglucosamine diphosphorylase/glucosamine-1-phosphate N-acetyltransferase GlmU [Chloroflexota bacterium]
MHIEMGAWTAIVLAAGRGARMRSSRPKVLHTVAGVPMVCYAADAARVADANEVIVVTRPKDRSEVSLAVGEDADVVEQPDPLGTGHALTTALIAVSPASQHVLVINGDVPLVRRETVQALAALHERRKATATLLCCTMDAESVQQVGRLQRGARGKPIGVLEVVDAPMPRKGEVEVNVGVYAFDARWLRRALCEVKPRSNGEYYLTDLFPRAVADGKRIEAFVTQDGDEALSVNTRQDLARVEAAAQDRLRDAAMTNGATLVDPATVYLDATVQLGPDVTVHPNTTIRGNSKVERGASLGPNAQLLDSDVGPEARVGSAVVEDSVLGPLVHVGPFSHIRSGCVLEESAYVGSHVEIKASRICSGAHVGHFSYIGDAVVGAGANIGAGTVTCNFDGESKHETHIGEGAFIGSDSLLIAPVKVGAGALTGAGAVVNRDVPPGGKVVGVPARPLGTKNRRALVQKEEGVSLG